MDYIDRLCAESGRSAIDEELFVRYVKPLKIIAQADGDSVINSDALLKNEDSQITLEGGDLCTMKNGATKSWILFDFGFEMQGGIQVTVHSHRGSQPAAFHIRFGESAAEAMSTIGGKGGATNDHAIRDSVYKVSGLGMTEIGNTGFRFVYIGLEGDDSEITVKCVRAKMKYRKLEAVGTFDCSDNRLNKIWETAAYTVHLCMQDYVWDGIKRDRLVWIGDMHPETSTIQYVFGKQDCVKRSLDIIRDNTVLPNVMNGIPAYSLWWVHIHHDFYLQFGDFDYLKEQQKYLTELLEYFSSLINEDGSLLIENYFLDWPSSTNPEGQKAGVHALLIIAMKDISMLLNELGDNSNADFALSCADKLSKLVNPHNNSKQGLALQVLANQVDANAAFDELLGKNGVHGFSTFIGYYILKAIAESGNIEYALDAVKTYWGAMLDLGATTFWEDFDIDWTKSCTRIDELPVEGKDDIHGDFGGYCYCGYRHSFCHGWASGPAPFMMEYVLGVKSLEPGCKKILIAPNLGNLEYANGTFPTPYGIVTIKNTRNADGSVNTTYTAPKEVEVVLG